MTIVQLAQRLASRYLAAGELNLLPGDAQIALCDAVNAATTLFYNLAPPIYQRGTLSFSLPAPVTINGVQVTPNSSDLGSAVFSDEQRGCSVQITGDPNWNEVVEAGALMNAYLGATARTDAQALLYSDTALCGSGVFAGIVGEPQVFGVDHPKGRPLRRDDSLHALRPRRIGPPDSYSILPTALPGSSESLFALRVHPMPETACVVRVGVDLRPLQFCPDDLTRAVDLPIPDHLCLLVLLPMAANVLQDTAARHWRQGATPPNQAAAIEQINRLPNTFATPENYVGTPTGW